MRPIPFVVGQWVRGERFYGRSGLIAEILGGQRDALWLLGTRRIGKTSLLKQLEQLTESQPERGFCPLFWDLEGAADAGELHLGFSDALLDAEERLGRVGVRIEEVAGDDLFAALGRLRRRLSAHGLRLLLLCDEAEELVALGQRDGALLRKLRRTLQSGEEIRTVLASTIRLWDLAAQTSDTSPFLHGFTPPLFLATLADAEARALIHQENLDTPARPTIDAAAAELIRARCGNHPFLLQLVCKRFCESGDLEAGMEHVASDRMVSHFFAVDFDMLRPPEQAILSLVAQRAALTTDELRDALPLPPGASAGALADLEGLGLLRRDPADRLTVANSFFRRWLLEAPRAATGGSGPSSTTRPAEGEAAVLDQRYELRRRVGAGATGVVYEAWDRLLRTRIAVKLLRAEYAGNRAVLERYRQEILLSRDLAHPNILRVYHLGESARRAYLTMQWVDGPTLAERIRLYAPLPEAEILALGRDLASALAAAHARRVLHRDIKPQNVLLDRDGRPLVADFGLARLLGGPSATSLGAFLGTPQYASPEQAMALPLDERSDIYSLGVVLFEMATGRCPFLGETAADVLEQHRRQPPPQPAELAPSLSPRLAALIHRCLAKNPDERFAGAVELHAALSALAPPGSPPPPPTASLVATLAASAAQSPTAADLLPLVYDEMRRMARGFLSRERQGHTLQPTALVHEAYLKLAGQGRVDWRGRTHFLAVASQAMRRLLVDYARQRARGKRGGGTPRVSLHEELVPGAAAALDFDELLALDGALDRLARVSERQAKVVEARFFAGLTVKEVAELLGVSARTVEAEWTAAREWLRRELENGDQKR